MLQCADSDLTIVEEFFRLYSSKEKALRQKKIEGIVTNIFVKFSSKRHIFQLIERLGEIKKNRILMTFSLKKWLCLV